MTPQIPHLSIVVPVYNESERLSKIDLVFHYLQNKEYSSEVIMVNDGSSDNTLNILKKYSKKYTLRIVSYPNNRGKGYAIKRGVLSARGRYVIFMDIDLSTPLKEIKRFLSHVPANDIVIGTRKHHAAKIIRHQPFLRELFGKMFTKISCLILQVQYSDFTCGLKLFENKLAKQIFSQLTISRWGFDSEILYLATRYGAKVKEVPVTWINDPRSKVRLVPAIISTFMDLLTVRLNSMRGVYR